MKIRIKTKTIKKVLIVALIFLICASIIASTVAIAMGEENIFIAPNGEEDKIYTNSNNNIVVDGKFPYDWWLDFSNKFINRTSGTAEEKLVADYLKTQFIELGLSDYNGDYFQNFSQYDDNGDGTGTMLYSQNVVGVQKSKTGGGKQIVIGAHYDNSFNLTGETHSQGAYDNASGVTNVITMAKVLKDFEFDFDIVYVLFGMEERGMYGSSSFVNKLGEVGKNNTLLMINFDSTICGDYLYAYSDELPRLHEDIFFESDKTLDMKLLRRFPADKKAMLVNFGDTFFVNVGQMSDNYSFINADINTISFSGYNLESKTNVAGIEKEGSTDIMHTSNDNVEKILKLYGEEFVTKRLSQLPSVALSTILRNDFVQVMEKSDKFDSTPSILYKKWFIGVVYGVVVAGFVLALWLVMRKLKKEKAEPIQSDPVVVSQEDVFKFVEELKKANEQQNGKHKDNDDDDDIFGLK
ncbi:MAG: M28 family peptidase [Clostridia bacterium]